MIDIDALSFTYVGRRDPTIRDLSLTIPRGQSVLVLGPSGCGKSTLALCLNGAVPHAIEGTLHGTVRIDGLDTRRASMADLAQRVGIVFQDPEAQFCMLTVEDEVAFGLENLAVPRAEMGRKIDDALGLVGLGHRRTERIERLSGGQKQRLALACVLAQEPDILVLDEPTAQLDPAGAADLLHLLADIRATRGYTLVIVEHRLDDVMPLVDRTLVFNARGELVADGPPRTVIHEHGAWLAEAGVWTPHVSELARSLEGAGLTVEPFPLTVAEAVEAFAPHRALLDRMADEESPHPPPPSPASGRGGAAPHVGARFIAPAPQAPTLLTEPPTPHAPASRAPGGTPPRTVRLDAPAPPTKTHMLAGSPSPTHGRGGRGVRVEVRGLTYQYPRAPRPVLTDLSVTLRAGELVALVGANGAGKSTLARLIAGIVRAPAGTVWLDSQDAATIQPAALARDIGYVFQYPEHQFVGQTVLDDVAYGPRHAGVPEAEALARARMMLDDFGLLRLALAHPFTLSHGEQRRLSVASMLILGQRVLLLDEPTFGQDQRNATMLLDKLQALAAEGRAIVAVSHDMRLVAERAHRVLVLVDGALAFDGPPAALFADAGLLQRAHLLPPPLWELSQRLGLRAPLLRVDGVGHRDDLDDLDSDKGQPRRPDPAPSESVRAS